MSDIVVPTEEDTLRRWVEETGPHTLARALNRSELKPRIAAFRLLPHRRARQVLALLDPVHQADVLDAAPEAEQRELLNVNGGAKAGQCGVHW